VVHWGETSLLSQLPELPVDVSMPLLKSGIDVFNAMQFGSGNSLLVALIFVNCLIIIHGTGYNISC